MTIVSFISFGRLERIDSLASLLHGTAVFGDSDLDRLVGANDFDYFWTRFDDLHDATRGEVVVE